MAACPPGDPASPPTAAAPLQGGATAGDEHCHIRCLRGAPPFLLTKCPVVPPVVPPGILMVAAGPTICIVYIAIATRRCGARSWSRVRFTCSRQGYGGDGGHTMAASSMAYLMNYHTI